MPSITVAVPTFNDDPAVLERVLRGAVRHSPGAPVIVVDMSTDDGVASVCERLDGINYEPFPDSGGVSHSRNRCVELAGTRHVAFLDSDGIPDPGFLAPLAERVAEEEVAVAGSRVLGAFECPPSALLRTVPASDWLSLFDLGDISRDVPRVMGTCYAIDTEQMPTPVFDESLGRRPGFPLAIEEALLCQQVRAQGRRVVYEPRSVVRHHVPASRATLKWMWRRAHTAGRETKLAGRFEPIPRERFGAQDLLFQAIMAPAFLAGLARPLADRDH